jgi:hypothetical protein
VPAASAESFTVVVVKGTAAVVETVHVLTTGAAAGVALGTTAASVTVGASDRHAEEPATTWITRISTDEPTTPVDRRLSPPRGH